MISILQGRYSGIHMAININSLSLSILPLLPLTLLLPLLPQLPQEATSDPLFSVLLQLFQLLQLLFHSPDTIGSDHLFFLDS